MPRQYIGADLSSEWIDIFNPRTGELSRIENNKPDITHFMRNLEPEDIFLFEATSGCDDIVLDIARRTKTPFVRVNPAHAWFFAKACNLPKTDRVDARMLSAFGAARCFEPQDSTSLARDRLKALVKRRRQFKDMEVQEKNRLRRIADADIRSDILSLVAVFTRRVEKLNKKIQEHIAVHPELHALNSILRSTPGIGEVSASVLIADMPELGTADRRQIASLAGLAPRAFESGKFRGKRKLGAGRRHVRKALYMAALSVIAQGRLFRTSIDNMRAAGKAKKTIILAVARKLLTLVNTMVRDGAAFDVDRLPHPPHPQ